MNNKQYILYLVCGFWIQHTFLTPILCLKIQIYKFYNQINFITIARA